MLLTMMLWNITLLRLFPNRHSNNNARQQRPRLHNSRQSTTTLQQRQRHRGNNLLFYLILMSAILVLVSLVAVQSWILLWQTQQLPANPQQPLLGRRGDAPERTIMGKEGGAIMIQPRQPSSAALEKKDTEEEKQPSSLSLLEHQDAIEGSSSFPVPSIDSLMDGLPTWIQNYVAWHQEQRRKFPGSTLFTDPNAPKLLIRTCLGLCGGLNDRLGQLPWDLYLANQTQRLLLMHWHRPVPLEAFLEPAGPLDWRVPRDEDNVPGFFPPIAKKGRGNNKKKQKQPEPRVSREGMQRVRALPDLFAGFEADHPNATFWSHDLDASLRRATVAGGDGDFTNHRVLRHRLLGHLNERILAERLAALGETDDLSGSSPSFGKIFRLFFRPSPPVHQVLNDVFGQLQLHPNQYSALHCRVRHPKAFVGLVKGKNEEYPADKSGLPWNGEMRRFAIATAVHALQCMQHDLRYRPEEPVYFFSDSNDLARFMTLELRNPEYVKAHNKELGLGADDVTAVTTPPNASVWTVSSVEPQAYRALQSTKVVARSDVEAVENAHIDRQKGRPAEAYYGTFVDFFLATQARCVAYGVGFFAVLATKVSHTPCRLLHQGELWGTGLDEKLRLAKETTSHGDMCPPMPLIIDG